MNAYAMAKTAYANPSQSIRTERDIEFDAFARITSRLRNSAAKGKDGFPELAAAVYENRKLWSIISADVSSDENGLPKALRARLYYLNKFTQQHSGKVLKQSASVDPLIEINTAIMRGLRRKGEAA
ncbi:flagellar biosynthesis regulator FlhF [Thioclava sp. SK-1]|uniref:flagellar biosynthesis regulator FlaF n=1 Tax=Thioclava sp. SK-1 TaxID=1889770 RepID=UPI00082444F3|nr:flagellar biosynthesis regulator FlaF [Thioclava sp. SK-1]OCX63398.1 flagellar biosynthesis regulator FlhF [Thioclava sp. SK-1]